MVDFGILSIFDVYASVNAHLVFLVRMVYDRSVLVDHERIAFLVVAVIEYVDELVDEAVYSEYSKEVSFIRIDYP